MKSTWDRMNPEQLLEDAKRQHRDKLDAEKRVEELCRALRLVILENRRSKGAAIARQALGWEPGETH